MRCRTPPVVPVFVPVLVLLLAGCAGTAPKPEFVRPLAEDSIIDANDKVAVVVAASPGVVLQPTEKQRLTDLVAQQIAAMQAANAAGDERSYRVEVDLTRYDKGNALARAMLAGLGQIHIDARVTLLHGESGEQLSVFKIEKTFAWGGVYGGVTGIEDVEPAFAAAIAATVTATAEPPAAQ
jgi:hypothetical protein